MKLNYSLADMSHKYNFVDWKKKGTELCYYTAVKEDQCSLTEDTKEALQHRIDPNIMESERLAVECMVYTPGSK